jgi:hypothetical protein
MSFARSRGVPIAASGLLGALLVASGVVVAADPTGSATDDLRRRIAQQTERLDALKRALAEEEAKLSDIRRALGPQELRAARGGDAAASRGAGAGVTLAQGESQPAPVGQAPARKDEGRPPEIAPIFESPGVLTQPGKYVIEPSLQYTYSSSNRISLVGYTIIPALLIGLIDIREVKRNTWTAGLTGRIGLTNRLELEAKIPWVYRSDSVVSREFIDASNQREVVFDSNGKGLGDVELTARYQLNDGGIDKPYYIGSLRFKSRTGKDPFEVETITSIPGARTGNDVQKQLPTGSGFYTLQPGLTALYASDPAVFFGGVSYQYNFKRTDVSLNTNNGSVEVGDVQPGGVLGFNFGMGLSLNERASFSIGYDHQSVGKTKINGSSAPNSVRVELGTLLLGFSYRLNDRSTLNLSLGAGLTRDTPDLQLTARLPMTF